MILLLSNYIHEYNFYVATIIMLVHCNYMLDGFVQKFYVCKVSYILSPL